MKKLILLIIIAGAIAFGLFLNSEMLNDANCETANIHQGGDLGSAHKVFSLDNDYMSRSDFEKDVIFFGCKIKGSI